MRILKRQSSDGKGTNTVAEYGHQTFTRMEKLHKHYSRNPEFSTYLNQATGVVHNCAVTNANACSAATIRLYKRAGSAQGIGPKHRAVRVSKSIDRSMRGGEYGRKLAEFTLGGADMVEVVKHPLLKHLANPNPMFAGSLLSQLLWYQTWIGGNAYEGLLEGDGRLVSSPLYSEFVQIVASEDEGGVSHYHYGRSNEDWGDYSPEQVVHYKLRPDPRRPMYGMGAMHGSLPFADLIKEQLIFDIALAKNGMRPDAIIQVAQGTGDDDVKKFERQFASKFRGVAKWFNPMVVKGDVKFTPTTWSERELLSKDKREESYKIIRQGFGHTEAMNDSNATTLGSALMAYDSMYLGGTIWPALLNDAATKNTTLLPAFGLDSDVYSLAYDPIVEKDQAKLSERLRLDLGAGFRTPNEVRVELGLEEFDDEKADALYVNGQPLGAVANPLGGLGGLFGGGSSPKTTGVDEKPAGNSEVNRSYLSFEEAKGEKMFDPYIQGAIAKDILALERPMYQDCEGCRQTKDDDDIAISPTLDEAIRKYQGGIESVFGEVIEEMQGVAIRAYANGNTPDLSTLRDQAASKLESGLQPIVELGITNVYDATKGNLGVFDVPDGAFDIVPRRALDFLRTHAVRVADDIAGTTADMSKLAVQRGLEQGLSIDKIAKEIEGIPAYRAERIARTEVQNAVQQGKLLGYKDIGVEKVNWVNAPGASSAHQVIASRGPLPIGTPFVKAGETIGKEKFDRDIYAPPARPNCRCDLQPVIGGEGVEV